MTILKVEGLCKAYPEFALRDVSFSMESGSVMGFIGRNGAGKTTTLKSLLHLVHPDAGRITLLGKDMDRDEQEIRRSIGFVSGGLSYYPRKHLRQITDATRRFYPTWDEKMYRSCLERFRLSEDKRTSELSEGMGSLLRNCALCEYSLYCDNSRYSLCCQVFFMRSPFFSPPRDLSFGDRRVAAIGAKTAHPAARSERFFMCYFSAAVLRTGGSPQSRPRTRWRPSRGA